MYRFGRRGRLGDEASSTRFLAKSVPRIGRLAMTLLWAIAAPPRRRSVSMSCARASVWTTVKVYGTRRVLPALRIRDFAQARSPKSNRIVSTRLARFLSVRRRRRQRRAGPTLSLDQVADPRSHPVVFSFLHLTLSHFSICNTIDSTTIFLSTHLNISHYHNHDLTIRHTVLLHHSPDPTTLPFAIFTEPSSSSGTQPPLCVPFATLPSSAGLYLTCFPHTERPLKVEVVVDPSKVPLAARVAPRPVPAAAPPAAASRGFVEIPYLERHKT